MKNDNFLKFYKNKKVFITGHTGFKGLWLTSTLLTLGAKITGYSLKDNKILNYKKYSDYQKVNNIFADILDFKKLEKTLTKFKPQIIFHLAAQPQVLESFENPLDTVATNVMGTSNLLEISRKYKFIKSIIIITTDKVYQNNDRKIKFSETDHLGGDDLYSASKACADITSLSYFKSFFKNSNCGIATARAGNCIGGGDWTKHRILTDATEAFLKNKNLLIRNPNTTRPWQHLLEPLLGYIILAEKIFGNKNKKYCTSWNFGPARKTNVKVVSFAKILKSKMKSTSKLILNKKIDKREKKNLDLNSNKANKELNWKSFLSISDTLKLTAEWYLANHQKQDMYNFTCKQIQKFLTIKNDL